MVCDPSKWAAMSKKERRLNPYSIGIWSATDSSESHDLTCQGVLILILLEYGLRQMKVSRIEVKKNPVLILILLEYGLRLH